MESPVGERAGRDRGVAGDGAVGGEDQAAGAGFLESFGTPSGAEKVAVMPVPTETTGAPVVAPRVRVLPASS